jgi:signal recognition particle GTPase
MTALLEQAVAKAPQLPEEKQNTIAETLLKTLTEMEREEPALPKPGRKAGSAKGLGYMTADFDEPLEDFKDYM